ncbi:MurR/RpiR family transcriptional regulator [Burkholderia sp. Ax-1719]|uniref:MurR/RpiR family transcriptional regulator n=1 Tax=Burkholderia sp. Ax-1719 TaxID=2608334 RepID=UPI00141DF032|nr:MurR/RpiR family transcriptional regulator [Burkholderia sp. Ax-1719]NIE64076.1 MurR/RpiR family transcriptional regulator [Burkholderia sp. Ax-1719]
MADETSDAVAGVDELMQRIAHEYEALPRQLKSIATYIEQNRASVMMDRTSDIAASCGVHPSAVVRFAQRFGFSGFSDLQAVFRQAYAGQGVSATSYQQRIRQLIDAKDGEASPELGGTVAREFIGACRSGLDELEAGLDDAQFDAAVQMLEHADNIYVIGVRRSFPVASYIVYALQHTRKRVHLISGLGGMYHEQIRSVKKGDVVVAISFAPYGKETQYCLRAAQQHQAKTLVITDSQLSPLARHADAQLYVKEGSAFAFRSLTSTFCLCQALFVALAYRLELNVEESTDPGGYDD